jgi:DNA-binding LacI/PurR family transcriptional regulator
MGIEDVALLNSHTQPGENSALKAHEFMKNRMKTDGLDFTGLFVLTDMTALGAMSALHGFSISIPGQVSVIGFGDEPESSLYHPSLTTIGCNYQEVAREAVDIIEKRLSGDTEEVIQKFIPMTLVERESTGHVPA